MSFTTQIKNEISQIEVSESEKIAELSAFVKNNATIEDEKIILTTENNNIAKRIGTFLQECFDVSIKVDTIKQVTLHKNELYLLAVTDKIDFLLQSLSIYDEANHKREVPEEYIVGANEEIRAYLRGCFLCQGSINDPKTSRYHMELLISEPKEAVFVQKLLNLFDLNVKILTRDKGYMLYIKEADKISDYLKIIKANNAVLYFENQRIYRNKKNQANRLNNCEQANMDKVVATATAQLDDITIIEENLGTSLLDDKTQEALEYRKKYPEASLKELSEIITIETGNPITKSGLNHRFRKIKELATRFKNLDKK